MKNWLFQSWPILLLVAVFVILAFYWRQSVSIEQIYLQQAQKELYARGRLLGLEVQRRIEDGDLSALDEFCRQEGTISATRVTVVAADGRVLADSEENSQRMDNHANRPEIADALQSFHAGQKFYSSVRHSATLGQRLLYCAVPIVVDGKLYVIRTAFSVKQLDELLSRSRWNMVAAIVGTALLAGLFSWIIFRTVSRPVRELCAASGRIAAGELDIRLPIPERGAIRELAVSLSRMAEELKSRINEISREKSERDAIFSALTEGVLVLDMEARLIDVNAAARNLFQLRDASLGQPLNSVVRQSQIAEFVGSIHHAPAPLEAEFSLELPIGVRQLRLRGSLVRWGEDRRLGMLLVIYDMTQLRKLENFRRDFVANVSHEIKTPLTVIRGAVETLRDGALQDPENADRFLQIIELHAQRLNALVQDILSLSQLEYRALGDRQDMVPINALAPIATAVKLARSRGEAGENRIRLTHSADPMILADVQLLEQAVFNLIDNALKYSGSEKPIEVNLVQENDWAVIEVRDYGCGIPLEHQARVFERFYRVDKARSRKLGGTGLGLAIVKHVVQLHRGTIALQSEVGRGSVFCIRIPVDHQS